jgi:Xaa-Pro aminopeptidase
MVQLASKHHFKGLAIDVIQNEQGNRQNLNQNSEVYILYFSSEEMIFSEQQKIIYNIVLEAQEAGIKTCVPGAEFRAANKAAVAVIQKRLIEKGIIKNANDYLDYFFHGTSHYLGLDVHDPGNYGKLIPGNVITVEPGIYIPAGSACDPMWWNIGVRIEDDILITTGNPEVLSEKLPKKIEEIEALMKEESRFNSIK